MAGYPEMKWLMVQRERLGIKATRGRPKLTRKMEQQEESSLASSQHEHCWRAASTLLCSEA
jgi:hypothetical protein